MDKEKALRIFEQIKETDFNGYIIKELINNGKSAAVFKALNDNKAYAIKIFDNELISKYGLEIQTKRFELELEIKDYSIKNLIQVVDGGQKRIKTETFHYLIMDFIDGLNLKQYISEKSITIDFIISVIKTLLDVSEKLLECNPPFAHRDIKPENIMISNNNDIILMDLGVLKVIDKYSFTDIGSNEQKAFLGTLRYGHPEFITRKEENTPDGWRAINIYQIGTVLHDMIMKKELFEGVEPYTNLVLAITEEMPNISNIEIPSDIIQLSRNMLSKDWKKRLQIANINTIKSILDKCLLPKSTSANIFEETIKITESTRSKLETLSNIRKSTKEKKEQRIKISQEVLFLISDCISEISEQPSIKSIIHSDYFISREWITEEFNSNCIIYKIEGTREYGFIKPIYLLFCVDNDEKYYSIIKNIGILLPRHQSKDNLNKPLQFLKDVFFPRSPIRKKRDPQQRATIHFNILFDGIFSKEDNSLKEQISTSIAKFILKSIKIMEPVINQEIERENKIAGRTKTGVYCYSDQSYDSGLKIIYDFS